jgi:hypothetical protein
MSIVNQHSDQNDDVSSAGKRDSTREIPICAMSKSMSECSSIRWGGANLILDFIYFSVYLAFYLLLICYVLLNTYVQYMSCHLISYIRQTLFLKKRDSPSGVARGGQLGHLRLALIAGWRQMGTQSGPNYQQWIFWIRYLTH